MIPFSVRLFLHLVAIGLLVSCLAYWWLDNLAHEVFGTLLFALVIMHVVINRRWYRAVFRGRTITRSLNTMTIVGLAIAMTMMLLTSLLISRDIFAFVSHDAAFGVREVHMFGAYWIVLIVAIHLGLRWSVVMTVCRRIFGISKPSALRSRLLRAVVIILALLGIKGCFEMAFGTKLLLAYSLDMWDFNESTIYLAIIALIAALAYYALMLTKRVRRRGARRKKRLGSISETLVDS